MAVSREQAREILVRSLYERSNNPGAQPEFEEKEIYDLVGGEVAPVIVHTILNELLRSRLIRQTRAAPVMFEILDSLLDEAERAIVLAPTSRQVDDLPGFINSSSIPASDRFVTLDHNGDTYREAVAALDAAVAAFREDHGLDNEWGPEKGVLLRTLEAGRELLRTQQVRIATVFSTIVAPLQIIRDRYQDAVVAGLVTAGADPLIHALGHALSSILSLIGLS
jgi:hypothetical protein